MRFFTDFWMQIRSIVLLQFRIYTGMAHDTGVFQYSSTTPETMRIAGELMKTGFDFSKIIDESFYQKTYIQNQVMGRVLAESILLQDGKCVVGYLKKREMDFYGVEGKDLEGIVSQLRLTAGVEVAIFIYEMRDAVLQGISSFQRQGRCKQDCRIFRRRRTCTCSRL